jgi:acetolactate synthase-1/2/3 large subunit
MYSPMARLHVHGRTLTVCQRLVELIIAERRPNRSKAASTPAEIGERNPEVTLQMPDRFDSDATPIKPQRLMKVLSQCCPPHTRFVADIGNSMIWATHCLQPRDRRMAPSPWNVRERHWERRSATSSWLRVTMDFCPMGWAIGAAVGIASGNPIYPVVCITGDGSYLMNGQEITTAAQQQLTVIFVVLNDGALGMVKHGQRLAGAESIACELPQVDYRRLAESMGIPGHVIKSPQDLENLDFDAILSRRGPTMLDVRIDPDEVPPMTLRLKTLGAIK